MARVVSREKDREKTARIPESNPCVGSVNSLLSRRRRGGKNQFAKRFGNVEVRRWRPRRPPRGVKSRFGSAFNPVKIHSPGSGGIESMNQTFHRQRQLRNPHLSRFVQSHAPPQTTVQIVLFARCDIKINPESIGADFKFLITTEIRRIRLQEDFGHVTIPELVAPAIRLGIGKNCNQAVFRAESQEKGLRSPE